MNELRILRLLTVLASAAVLTTGCASHDVTSSPQTSEPSVDPPTTGRAPQSRIIREPVIEAPVGEAPVIKSNDDYVETIEGTAVQFDMVWIEDGNFWIGRTEVTWDSFLPYCDFDESGTVPPGADAVSKPSKPLDVVPYHRDWGIHGYPAVGVSWNAAKKYCEWLSLNTGETYRLPTESEWEIACGPMPDGPLGDVAWFDGNSNEQTEKVSTKAPNVHGLHDMLGNLWEYCLDPFDPAKPDRAVLRGGSWLDPPDMVTPTARLRFSPAWVLDDPNVPPGVWWVPDGGHLGFRVIREGP